MRTEELISDQVYFGSPAFESNGVDPVSVHSSSNNNGTCSASCPLPQAAGLLKKTLTLTSKHEERKVGLHPALKGHGQGDTEAVLIKKEVSIEKPPIKRITHNEDQTFPMIPYLASCMSLVCIGIMSFLNEIFQIRVKSEKNRKGYTTLYTWWETFYQTQLLRRVWSGMFTPIASPAGPKVTVIDRESPNQGWTISMTTKTRECINLGSYNYLSMTEMNSPCLPGSLEALKKYGVGNCSQGRLFGTTPVHLELEKCLAEFIGVDAALTFGMGFATNSLNIPSIMNSESIVFSDQLNHASIIVGMRLSGAKICVFKHNDMNHLEKQIRKCIITGNKGRPWKKIFIVVEGVYSMHGSIAKLPELIELKEKYGAILYLDEAHCMGALGANGRGLTQYFNIDPRKVDILMGTFAKSFGAIGGYIAGSKDFIETLKKHSIAHHYGTVMPPCVAAFILEGVKLLDHKPEGRIRVQNLLRNTRYFRQRMQQMGYVVSGDDDSPVVPISVPLASLVYIIAFMREKHVAAVMVSYPATPITEGRIRCCMNAFHTKEMIDYVLTCFEELADDISILRISTLPRRKGVIPY